jgi:large subunit ribosomal protein L33
LRFAIREGGRTVGAGTVSGDSGLRWKRMPREIITFQCTECKNRNYTKTKNKKTTTERLEMKKFCPFCRKHQAHKETK